MAERRWRPRPIERLRLSRHLFITVLNQAAVGGFFLNLAPVTSDLVRDLGATYADVGLATTLFILGQVAASVPAGYLSDRFGVKRIYLAANVATLLAALLLALARSMGEVLFLRFVLGTAMGTQFVVGSSYLAFWSPPGKTALYQGIYGSGFNFGIALSFLLAGPQVALLGWRGVFLAPGVASLLSTALIWAAGREPPKKPGAPSMSLRRLQDLPMGALSLLGVSMAAAWGTFVVLGAWLTEYLVVAREGALWLSSVLTGINVAGSGLGRILGGVVAKPGRESRAILWFYAIVIATAAGMTLPAGLPVLLTLGFLVVTAASMGFAPSIRLCIQVSEPALQGTAVGYLLALGMVLASSLPTVFGWVVEATGSFAAGFGVVVAAPAAGLLAMLRVQARHLRPESGP
ncbi:MAG: MFS transporter [Candidatus Tectomicrobia bacterium]|nr:MFS transporter [Candidatus Tectomicrobia bacterium]